MSKLESVSLLSRLFANPLLSTLFIVLFDFHIAVNPRDQYLNSFLSFHLTSFNLSLVVLFSFFFLLLFYWEIL